MGETRVRCPLGVSQKTLKKVEKRLQVLKPDACHGFSVGRPEQLHLMAFQNSNKIAKTAAEDGLVELGSAKKPGG